MANKTKALNVLLEPEVKAMLEEMAEHMEYSQARVTEAAIRGFYKSFERERVLSEERARRCVALFDRLKALLGESYFEGLGPVGFALTADDRVMVEVDGLRYFAVDPPSQKLAAVRESGRRAEFAEVLEGGLGEWMMTSLGEPALN